MTCEDIAYEIAKVNGLNQAAQTEQPVVFWVVRENGTVTRHHIMPDGMIIITNVPDTVP